MKYFSKKMWLGLQDEKSSKLWEQKWRQNSQLYINSLRKLRGVISARNYSFFVSGHQHGDYLLSITLINKGKTYRQKETGELHVREITKPVDVEILTLCPTGRILVLKYTNARDVFFDFPSNNPLWFNDSKGFGSWGYDEISLAKNKFLVHEILFDSGATIKIKFEKFSYLSRKSKSKGARHDFRGQVEPRESKRKRKDQVT